MSKEEKEKQKHAQEEAQKRYEALKKAHKASGGLVSIFKSATDIVGLALCGALFAGLAPALLPVAPFVPLAAIGLGGVSLVSVLRGTGRVSAAQKGDTPEIKTLKNDFSHAVRGFTVQQVYSMMAGGFSYLILDAHVQRVMTQTSGPDGLPPAAIASAIAVAFSVFALGNARRAQVYAPAIALARAALPPPKPQQPAVPAVPPEAKSETPPVPSAPEPPKPEGP